MQKAVLKLENIEDTKRSMQKALKAASILDVCSVSLDIKEKKLTVIGTMDPAKLIRSLRHSYQTQMISFGPEKPPALEEPPQSEKPPVPAQPPQPVQPPQPPKPAQPEQPPQPPQPPLWQPNSYYYPGIAYPTPTYYARSVEDNPNGCVIL